MCAPEPEAAVSVPPERRCRVHDDGLTGLEDVRAQVSWLLLAAWVQRQWCDSCAASSAANVVFRTLEGSNLVDSASSHTLVSKIKPCMSKYKSFTLKLRMAHYISYSLFDSPLLLG